MPKKGGNNIIKKELSKEDKIILYFIIYIGAYAVFSMLGDIIANFLYLLGIINYEQANYLLGETEVFEAVASAPFLSLIVLIFVEMMWIGSVYITLKIDEIGIKKNRWLFLFWVLVLIMGLQDFLLFCKNLFGILSGKL